MIRVVTLLAASLLLCWRSDAQLVNDDGNLAWASYRDLTSSRYAELFSEHNDAGFMLIDTEAYSYNDDVRYAMVWRENTDGTEWRSRRNMSAASFEAFRDEYEDRLGLRLRDIELYRSGSEDQYAAIWVQNRDDIEWELVSGLSSSEYHNYTLRQRENGWRPVDVEAFGTSEGIRFAGVWLDNSHEVGWAQWRNMTRVEYQHKVDSLGAAGYWVIDYETYEVDGARRYAAIWEERPANRAYRLRTDLSELQYSNTWRQSRDEGFRLVSYEHDETPDGRQHGGIWVENSSRYRYTHKTQLADRIEGYRTDNDIKGISVAIIHSGRTVFRRGFGLADEQAGKVAHGNTIYLSASVSKVIGSTLAAKLETEGRLADGTSADLDLKNSTSTYLSNIPSHHTHSVEQLLTHLGCVPHYTNRTTPGYSNSTLAATHFETARDASAAIWDTLLVNNCTIGETRTYSTAAFTFVGAVLEEVTERPISRLVREEIAERYGLSSLRAQYAEPVIPADYDRSIPYTTSGRDTTYSDNSWKVLGGGLEMDVIDLARFGRLILDGEILSEEIRDERLWMPIPEDCTPFSDDGRCRNGLGWVLQETDNRRYVQHDGSATGAGAFIRLYPNEDLVIAILSNLRGATHPLGDLVNDLADAVLPSVQAQHRYVATHGSDAGGNDCSDPFDPCRTIQSALTISTPGDIVSLTAGEFTEAVRINHDLHIQGQGEDATFLQASSEPGTASSRVLWIADDVDVSISDLTVRNGIAFQGAGINNRGHLRLERVRLTDNEASSGGGMYNSGGDVALVDVTFAGNTATATGGGLYNDGSSPALQDVTFFQNAGNRGGGMYNRNGSSPTLRRVTFEGNTAQTLGGGMYTVFETTRPVLVDVSFLRNSAQQGGAMYTHNSSPILTDVAFVENSAEHDGGAMYSTISSATPRLTNVLMIGNTADRGGAIYNQNAAPILTNVTITENHAESEGGGMYNYLAAPVLRNAIIWGNEVNGSPAGTSASVFNSGHIAPMISYSLVAHSGGSGTAWVPEIGEDGGHNIDAFPDLRSSGTDRRPGPLSPALDSGTNSPFDAGGDAYGVTTDIAGGSRIVAGVVDLGAYEQQGLSSAARFVRENGASYAFDEVDITITFEGIDQSRPLSIFADYFRSPVNNASTEDDAEILDVGRWAITKTGGSFESATVTINNITELEEEIDSDRLALYSRPTVGSGTFSMIENASYNKDTGSMVATVTQFSEFVLAHSERVNVDTERGEIPDAYSLKQNYPNPFNPSTTIRYALVEPTPVRLEIFDALGRRVALLLNEDTQTPGWHEVQVDATGLSAGMYLYRLSAGAFVATRSMLLIK